ncbi:hypothetical protein [Methylocystis parvus]|uniref:Uncharacterized protein n=1 Tax=Methylocystis parvus TaxID=134 RepID=A0A6B8M7Q7_9HYPH|nr:hypothetical protein [Methylocystis parvus]QGN00135.1 hypothetical protein F7D14_21435 [Methylocystis parvus]WBK02557.1 hypothetical protein MMG94_21200 [Methylocystis parvus OBBP]
MSAITKRLPLDHAAAAEGRRLAADPNIVSVGFGLKFVGGKPTMEVALHYYVREKLAADDAIEQRGSEKVPPQVEGYKTDVLLWKIARANACPDSKRPTAERGSRREDPLVGGTSTAILGGFSNILFHYGTLGGICFDAGNGAAMAISNAHVWGSDLGTEAIQPFPPVSDYVGGAIEWLACGGPLSHLFTWTAPSALTGVLTGAAAAAWVAAAASDAEDPNRWGQRVSPIPAAGVKTTRERIQLVAKLPRIPFPGRHWSSKAMWDYTRDTTAGSNNVMTDEARSNEHVLVGKRVFTDRNVYSPGDTVGICAQLWTLAGERDPERFVVAHSFPIRDPGRVIQRVLRQGAACARLDRALDEGRQSICIHGFPHQVAGVAAVNFPLIAAPFVVIGEDSSELLDPGPNNPSGVSALRLPKRLLAIACPPSTHVDLSLFHRGAAVRVRAISANGAAVDQAVTPPDPDVAHRLRLTGPEIIRIELDGRDGDGFLAEICVDKRMIGVEKWKGVSTYYGGSFPLPRNEPDGKWAVVVISQSLDNTPTNGDPIAAARKLGGIVDSANVSETGECACEILFDATFDVAAPILL